MLWFADPIQGLSGDKLTETKSNEVITSIDQVTTAWLTAVLTRSGALARGAVAAFDVLDGRGNWSTNARLDVIYNADVQGSLQRYHATLIGRDVRGYGWQQLWDDYGLCAAMGVYVAVEYCRGGINERWIDAWLLMLQRSLTACDDLDCRALWQERALT